MKLKVMASAEANVLRERSTSEPYSTVGQEVGRKLISQQGSLGQGIVMGNGQKSGDDSHHTGCGGEVAGSDWTLPAFQAREIEQSRYDAQTVDSRSAVAPSQENISAKRGSPENAAAQDDVVIEPEWTDNRTRAPFQRIQHQRVSPDQVIVVESRPSYLHSAKFLGLGFFLGAAAMLGLGVLLLPRATSVAPVAGTAAPSLTKDGSLADAPSHPQPATIASEASNGGSFADASSNPPSPTTAPKTETPAITAPATTEQPAIQSTGVAAQPPTPPPPAVEATISSAGPPTPPQTIKAKETPRLQSAPNSSQAAASKPGKRKPEVALPTEPDPSSSHAEDDATDTRFAVERDGEGRILVRKIKPNPVGGAPLIDNIGVKAKYHYATGYEPVAVTYFDGRDRAIAIEVEVVGIEKDGVASAIGLLPGDRLLSYDGEKLRSVQRLVFLTGFPGEAPHKLSYRHGKKFFTVEVPSGRLGVEVKNARAADAPKVVPSPEMQLEN